MKNHSIIQHIAISVFMLICLSSSFYAKYNPPNPMLHITITRTEINLQNPESYNFKRVIGFNADTFMTLPGYKVFSYPIYYLAIISVLNVALASGYILIAKKYFEFTKYFYIIISLPTIAYFLDLFFKFYKPTCALYYGYFIYGVLIILSNLLVIRQVKTQVQAGSRDCYGFVRY